MSLNAFTNLLWSGKRISFITSRIRIIPQYFFRPAQAWWSYCDTYFFNLYKIFNVHQFSLDFLFAGLFSWFYYEILENKLSTFFIPHQNAQILHQQICKAGGLLRLFRGGFPRFEQVGNPFFELSNLRSDF